MAVKKYLIFVCTIFALGLSCMPDPVFANTIEQTKKVLGRGIPMTRSTSSRMHVVFHHDKHLDFKCASCHHKMTPTQDVYTSCDNGSTCHTNMDLSDRTRKSYYLAMHALDTEKSCLGCHTANAAARPGINGCQACHTITPEEATTNAPQ